MAVSVRQLLWLNLSQQSLRHQAIDGYRELRNRWKFKDEARSDFCDGHRRFAEGMQDGVPDVRCLQANDSIVISLSANGVVIPRELELTYHTHVQTNHHHRLLGSS